MRQKKVMLLKGPYLQSNLGTRTNKKVQTHPTWHKHKSSFNKISYNLMNTITESNSLPLNTCLYFGLLKVSVICSLSLQVYNNVKKLLATRNSYQDVALLLSSLELSWSLIITETKL